MGVCQQVGGRSASGQNMDGDFLVFSVEHCLRNATSRQDVFDSCDAGRCQEYYSKNISFNTTHKDLTVHVTEYCPEVFHHLRRLNSVTDDHFQAEWNRLPDEQKKPKLGAGRSQALFLKSRNLDFMMKTVNDGEVAVLLQLLPHYVQHLEAHPESFVMRFLMVLQVQVEDETAYVLVFQDSFAHSSHINERWDLKGRKIKPGKFLEPEHPDYAGGGGLSEGTVLKDKELVRLFWMEGSMRERIRGVLQRDFDFLRDNGLMDYSILIGVSYNTDTPDKARNNTQAQLSSFSGGSPLLPTARRARDGDSKPGVVSQLANGVTSVRGEETYYFGVIDCLTEYNVKKKTANFFKKFLWKPNTLSTIPPPDYHRRISNFLDVIFPNVEEEIQKAGGSVEPSFQKV